jgi:hypothetical protein
MANPTLLDQQIDEHRRDLRTDKLDITYGELASMYQDSELRIDPEYQRLFRWSPNKKAGFIESLLLGIPAPAIFVAETDKGVWELVDGLQRLSTVLEFMGFLRDASGGSVPPSTLVRPSRRSKLPDLEGMTFENLTLRSRLSLKRASCRVEVLKVGSSVQAKYDLFERLNTGGEPLTDQEIRNCIFRASSPMLMDKIDELAQFPIFADSLSLSDNQQESKFDRGLVMRFLALKNGIEDFHHEVESFITDFFREVVNGERDFDIAQESQIFRDTFSALGAAMPLDLWRHYRQDSHRGGFSVYVFEAIAISAGQQIERVRALKPEELGKRILLLKQDPQFLANTGGGANSRSKLRGRIEAGHRILAA